MADLSRLSDAERRALLLLATGHTAKSAATLLGTTEAAVNERLREARRKTGVGSSRELARRVSQENRDEKIGVAETALTSDSGRRPFNVRVGWPVLLGALVMTILAAAIGAFAALAVSGQKAAAPPPAPQGPPRVVATYPAAGAIVPSGAMTLKVTFDRPMQQGWSFINRDAASTPPCDWRQLARSADGRSFSVTCKLEPGHAYWIGFNNANHQKFASTEGVPATPASLSFSTR